MQPTGPSVRRLAADRQLSLITLVSAITVVFILPIAVFRYLQGVYVVAIVDALLVAVSVGAAWRAWRTGNTRGPSVVIAMIITSAAILVPFFVGLSGALWLFPVSLFIFYMVQPWVALVLMALALLSLLWQVSFASATFFASVAEMVSFFAAATSTVVFSFFFALQANRQKAQLIHWATKDPLTGLYNRRTLEDELRIALSTRDRKKNTIRYGLIILDLDQFKQINDRFGHAVGDEVLLRLAELIKRSTRTEDRAFRYGGDEFVILLTDTDRAGMAQFGEKLVKRIAQDIGIKGVTITASMGAALLLPDDTQETWNQRADRCLYSAKDGGRNQVVVADAPTESAQSRLGSAGGAP
ncbi:MAG: GGDEF domain-containing protein [Alkalispirochaeta sp.]